MTHKYEAHFLEQLIFRPGMSAEQKAAVFEERSPAFHAQRIEAPLLLLQGSADSVVPREQAEEMERVLKGLGRDCRLLVFEGEGHGFRAQRNIKTCIEEEERLWKRTLLR